MGKYMVGSSIVGYNSINMETDTNIKDSIVVIVMNDSNINVPLYYTFVRKAIENGNKVVLVTTEKTEQFNIIAALMASMGRYDIYSVSDRDVITASYIETVEDRKPSYMEVQQFIGGDIMAYSKVSEIIMTLENMVDDGRIEDIKQYIEKNKESIDCMASAIDTMKKYADMTNSEELVKEIKRLEYEVGGLNDKIIEAQDSEKEAIKRKDELEEQIKQSKAEKEALMSRAEALEEQVQSGTPIISYYNEVNLAYTKHKIQRVLYFKELSYVPHTMSMINSMYELLTNSRKMNVKFVIYDNTTEIYEPYIDNNIKIINSKNYTINKPMLVGKASCLIAEPNPAITNDLLTVPDGYDVLIIYDRMHRYENIITGNNVTRIIVSSSSKEFEASRKKLGISVGDMILTSRNSGIHSNKELKNFSNIIDIDEIPDYNQQTQSAKVAKYVKMQCTSGERLLAKIFKVSNIEAMFR